MKTKKESQPKKTSNKLLLWIGLLVILAISVSFIYKQSNSESEMKQAAQSEKSEEKKKHSDYEEPVSEKKSVVVSITADGFSPETTKLKINRDVVMFKNTDIISHEVAADDMGKGIGLFNTGMIKPGEEITAVEYTEPGTYTYYLSSNPTVKGTFVVEK